jgi:hypothetical protein
MRYYNFSEYEVIAAVIMRELFCWRQSHEAGRSVPIFLRNVLIPSSGSNINPCINNAITGASELYGKGCIKIEKLS